MPHIHNFTEFFYVVGGSGKFQIRNDSHEISTGDMVLLNPQVEHTETSFVEDPLEYIVLGIEGVKLVTSLDSVEGFSIIHFNEVADDISQYLYFILAEAKRHDSGFEDVCQSLLNILLINLMRRTKITPRTADTVENASPKAMQAKAFIDAHFRENITLQSVADATDSNKYYLSHIFKAETDFSPMQYVTRLRLGEAQNLLINTDLSVTEIAAAVGYNDSNYFQKVFRRNVGLTPGNYRRRWRS